MAQDVPQFDQGQYDKLFGDISKSYESAEKVQGDIIKRSQEQSVTLQKQSSDMLKLADEPVARPEKLKLKDYPEPPDTWLKDPTQALGSVLSLFAVMSSLAARRPLVAALKAMTGVITGNMQGQKDQADYQLKRYQAATEQARS